MLKQALAVAAALSAATLMLSCKDRGVESKALAQGGGQTTASFDVRCIDDFVAIAKEEKAASASPEADAQIMQKAKGNSPGFQEVIRKTIVKHPFMDGGFLGSVMLCDDRDLGQANCLETFAIAAEGGVRNIALKDIPHSGAPEVYTFPCEGY